MLKTCARRGLTLIEILVAMAIMTILAAISWPVVERSKERGRRTSCASNLRQSGTAAQMYAQDYDERLPPAVQGDYSDAHAAAWADSFQPYIANSQLLQCPSNVAKMGHNPHGVFWRQGMYNLPTERAYSYGANAWPIILPRQTGGPFGLRLGTIADSCGTALVSEGDGATPGILAGGSYSLRDIEAQVAGSRHTLGGTPAINVVFCDGHVKWTRVQETVTPQRNIWTTATD